MYARCRVQISKESNVVDMSKIQLEIPENDNGLGLLKRYNTII